jgi:hypothetical protein
MSKKTKLPEIKTKDIESEVQAQNLPDTSRPTLPTVKGTSEVVDQGFDAVAETVEDGLLFITPHKDKECFKAGQDGAIWDLIPGVKIEGEDLKWGRWETTEGKRRMVELGIDQRVPARLADVPEEQWFKQRAKITLRLENGALGILSLPPFPTKDYSKWRQRCKAAGFDHYQGVFDVVPKQITFKSGNTTTLAKFKLIGQMEPGGGGPEGWT